MFRLARTPAVIAIVLLFDVVCIVGSLMNIEALRACADVPEGFRRMTRPMAVDPMMQDAPMVVAVNGQGTESMYLLRYRLCACQAGDSVRIAYEGQDGTESRTIPLVRRFSETEVATFVLVGLVLFLFGMYVVIWHRQERYALVLHNLSMCTGMMVLYDWGAMPLHPLWMAVLYRFVFDCAIWLVPALFFHFSFIWPVEKHPTVRRFLIPWYTVSFTGIVASAWHLHRLLLLGIPVQDTWYLTLHYPVNDAFVVVCLLATVASLEHSALIIRNAMDRKRVYWVLLGIVFGPLVDVFLIMVPRMMLGYELVTHSMMQLALLIGPVTLYIALRKPAQSKLGVPSTAE